MDKGRSGTSNPDGGTSAGRKRCFVISPIGPEGSAVREHADAVYEYIIKFAVDECGIDAHRSDHMKEPGRISDQMFRELVGADLCVAVLTGYNPNVFYELAVAQAAARPVIVLLEKGQVLPFDIADLRCVYYDLKPKSLFDKVYAREIIQHIRTVAAGGWKAEALIEGICPPGAAAQKPAVRFYAESSEFGHPEDFLRLLRETDEMFQVMGITLRLWKRAKGFKQVLAEKAAAGCRVRVLVMHKDNPVFPHLINDSVEETSFDEIARQAEQVYQFFTGLAADMPNVKVRRIQRVFPLFQLNQSYRWAVLTQMLYGERTRQSALRYCERDAPLFGIEAGEFDAVWQANDPPE